VKGLQPKIHKKATIGNVVNIIKVNIAILIQHKVISHNVNLVSILPKIDLQCFRNKATFCKNVFYILTHAFITETLFGRFTIYSL